MKHHSAILNFPLGTDKVGGTTFFLIAVPQSSNFSACNVLVTSTSLDFHKLCCIILLGTLKCPRKSYKRDSLLLYQKYPIHSDAQVRMLLSSVLSQYGVQTGPMSSLHLSRSDPSVYLIARIMAAQRQQ